MLLKNEREGKLVPRYDPQPYTVSTKKGSTLVVVREYPAHKVVTRDTSWFKKLKGGRKKDKGTPDDFSDRECDQEIVRNREEPRAVDGRCQWMGKVRTKSLTRKRMF